MRARARVRARAAQYTHHTRHGSPVSPRETADVSSFLPFLGLSLSGLQFHLLLVNHIHEGAAVSPKYVSDRSVSCGNSVLSTASYESMTEGSLAFLSHRIDPLQNEAPSVGDPWIPALFDQKGNSMQITSC